MLLTAMGMKSIIAMFLGLVIQFSQAQSCFAADAVNLLSPQTHSMDCCAGEKSCPCAKQSDPAQKPSPLIPATVELKWLVSKALDSHNLAVLVTPPSDTVQVTVSTSKVHTGFAGVPLAVAFCSFDI